MAKKRKAARSYAGDQLASMVRDSAQQIWLAGLGAFSKTQKRVAEGVRGPGVGEGRAGRKHSASSSAGSEGERDGAR